MERPAISDRLSLNPAWLFVVLLSGCAVPQSPEYEFIPPASAAGLQCLQRCDVQTTQCKSRVTQQESQCLAGARQQAVTELPGRLAVYENAIAAWELSMQRYERAMRLYDLQVGHARIMRNLSASRCRDRDGKDKRDCRPPRLPGVFLPERPLYPGKAPRRPTLQMVQTEIAARRCGQAADQCAPAYRQCYTACGGTVKTR